jgi:hypothetical protein
MLTVNSYRVLIFPLFHFFYIKREHAQTCIHTYVGLGNGFVLRKIRVTQNLQERNYCVTWGTPVEYILKSRYEILEQKEVPVYHTGTYRPISNTGYRQHERDCKYLLVITPCHYKLQ